MQPQSKTQTIFEDVSRIFLPLVILGMGIFLFSLMSNRPKIAREVKTQNDALVETISVEPYTGEITLNIDGVVVPWREISLATEVAGQVEWKSPSCRAGNYVSANTDLIRIDSTEYDIEVERLLKEQERADVEVKEVAVESSNTQTLIDLAKEDLDLQIKSLNRTIDLVKNSALSDANIDSEKQRVVAAKNSLTTLENQKRLLVTREQRLEQSRELIAVQLKRAKLDQQRSVISTPISGLIVSEAVQQNDYVTKSTPLLTIDDISKVEVRSNLKMEDLHWLWSQKVTNANGPIRAPLPPDEMAELELQIPQAPVTVIYNAAGQQFSWKGKLSRFEGVGIDEKTRTVPCRIVVPKPRKSKVIGDTGSTRQRVSPPTLMRGMYVDVLVHIQTNIPLVEIPERALRPGNRVWKVENDQLKIVDVKIAQRQKTKNSVLIYANNGDFNSGDRIVESPLASVVEGMAVREKSVE